MSFVSYEFKPFNNMYIIVDSKIGSIPIDADNNVPHGLRWVAAVVDAYRNRNLSIGRNLALAIIHVARRTGLPYKWHIKYQDRNLAEYVRGWSHIAKERDEYLEKNIMHGLHFLLLW